MIRRGLSNPVPSRAFTLVELLATISVIFLIMGIAVVAYTSALRAAKSATDRAAVNGLRLAVGQFKAEFGFVPPLVKDDGGPDSSEAIASVRGRTVPLVFSLGSVEDAEVLRGRDDARQRYSLLSLPYYILGALDAPIDGVDGLGFYEVRRDGTFAPETAYVEDTGGEVEGSRRSQRRYEPFFDTSRGNVNLWVDPSTRFSASDGVLSRNRVPWRFELRDRAGVGIRYYRWVPDERPLDQVFREDGLMDIADYSDPEDSGGLEGEAGYYNIPPMVLDALAGDSGEFPTELRAATYAIVAAGPNELFGDEGGDTAAALVSDDALRRQYAERLKLSEARLRSDADYRERAIRLAMEDNIVEVGS